MRDMMDLALKDQAARADGVLDAAPLGVYVVDAELRLRYVNPVALAAWGASAEVIGSDFVGVVHQVFRREYADEIVRIFRNTLETGESYATPGISELRADRGVTEHYEWKVARIRFPEGGSGVVCFFRDISKEVNARARIEESEEALRRQLDLVEAITSNASTALFIMDDRQHCVFMNEAAEKLTGYQLDEMQGAPLHNFVHHKHPDGRPNPLEECPIDRAFPERNQMQGEEMFVHKDGSFYPVAFTASPLRRGDRLEGTILEVQDIRDRKRVERALRASEVRHRALIAATSDSLYQMSPDWKQMWHLSGRKFLEDQLEPSERWLDKYIPPEEQPRVLEAIETSLRTRSLFELEHRVRRADGSVGWTYSRAAPLFNSQGEITEWFGTARDITAAKEAELRLQRSQQKFVELVEHAPFGLYVVDSKLRIVHINKVAEEGAFENVRPAFDRDLEEAMRIQWPEEAAREVVARFRHTLETGEPYSSGLFDHTRRDVAERQTYEWELHRVVLADGGYGVVCYYFDTTKLTRAEQALRDSEERLRLATEHAEIGLWDVDEVNGILIWPPRVKAMFGIGPDAPVTMEDFREGLHPEDRERVVRAYAAAADPKQRAIYDVEYRTVGKADGKIRWVAAKGRGVFDDQGRCLRVIGTATDITARKRTEAALLESEARFRELANNISQFAWMADESGEIVWFNQRWYDDTGTTPEEMMNGGWQKVHHPEFMKRVTEGWQDCVERVTEWEDTFPLRGKHGEWRWFLSRAQPIRDEHGRIMRWFGTNTDITDQRNAEARLAESEARFRQMADNISQFAWMADETGWLFWYNQRWYEYTGATFEDMQGWGWQKVHHPDHVQRVTERYQECIQRGEVWEDTFPLRRKDGAWRWFLSRACPIRDDHGRITRWFGTNTDITDQRNAELGLAESEARYRMLAEQVADGIFVADADGRYIDANQAASAMLGYSHEELLILHTTDVLEPKELSRVPEQIAALGTGGVIKGDWEFRRKNGSTFVGELIARQFPDGRMQGVVRDVTERRRVEDELRRANHDLEQFAYSASHDMQEPIRNIAVYSEMLEARYGEVLDERGRQFVRLVNESALRMDGLVKSLLVYAQSGSDKEEAREADAEVALRVTLANLATNIEKTGAEVVHGPLPRVAIAPGQLQQLFQNLIANGLKYRRDDIVPQIEVSAERSGAMWRFAVRDNGIGIAPKYQSQVFGLFKRLHSGSKYAGAGMGLAICQKIVERRGGRIWVESEGEGRGSVFRFTLPMAADELG